VERVVIRWTIGDVSSRGIEALSLSIAGARKIFEGNARYVVCVNTIPALEIAGHVTGMGAGVEWLQADAELPSWLKEYLDPGMAEGVAWKFAPVDIAPDLPTLALDNDVVLWDMPPSVRQWLEDGDSLLIAEDVRSCYGNFAPWCVTEPRNSGIRGTPAGFPIEEKLQKMLARSQRSIRSETDEQGLQVSMITREKHRVVSLEEVSICGYFRPHQLRLGSCGAHFVGVNARKLPFEWNGLSGETYVHDFWDSMKPQVLGQI